jgi:KaiC/GvpD/RAD55 family RecA-like ATPase
MDRSIIYVTTEYGPSNAEKILKERGLGKIEPGLLNFIDAYNETVGVPVSERPDTVYADCNDLSSIDIAISKLQERIGKKAVLLVFDSLTSPYLFNGSEILKFMRLTLSRFAAEGNSVLTCMDEGCGKSEDLAAMMSLANGVIKMEIEEDKQLFTIVKHPKVRPTSIEIPRS